MWEQAHACTGRCASLHVSGGLNRRGVCRWHTEMANLNSIVRTLIRLMYGAELPPGTHAESLQHYRAACALNPTRLVHKCAHAHAHDSVPACSEHGVTHARGTVL